VRGLGCDAVFSNHFHPIGNFHDWIHDDMEPLEQISGFQNLSGSLFCKTVGVCETSNQHKATHIEHYTNRCTNRVDSESALEGTLDKIGSKNGYKTPILAKHTVDMESKFHVDWKAHVVSTRFDLTLDDVSDNKYSLKNRSSCAF
jgi:hypothetical protein